MILSFHPCITADRQIILGPRAPGPGEARLAAQADAVLLPQTCGEALFRLCVEAGAECFPSYALRFAFPGKTGQARLFWERGLPHPETKVWESPAALRGVVRSRGRLPHRLPFLVKSDTDHEGLGIRTVIRAGDLEPAIADLEGRTGMRDRGVITQELVPAGGNVLRAVILDRRIITYWKRAPGAVIATIGRGAAVDFSWREDLQEKGRALAFHIRNGLGVDLAAVDMVFNMREPEPTPLVLEINYMFGRRGLGGSEAYYRLLFDAVKGWLEEKGLDSKGVGLV
jgi:ribosomal protein S6--L-glutamate ligase